VKRFRFPLERLLEVRQRAERERAQELGRAAREEQDRRDAIGRAVERLGRIGEQLSQGDASLTRAGTLSNLGLTVQAAADEIAAAECSHRESMVRLENEKDRYGEARKDRRVVERLREHRLEDWSEELKRADQDEQDGWTRHQARERS
jgi:flagellar export protein FliJ